MVMANNQMGVRIRTESKSRVLIRMAHLSSRSTAHLHKQMVNRVSHPLSFACISHPDEMSTQDHDYDAPTADVIFPDEEYG